MGPHTTCGPPVAHPCLSDGQVGIKLPSFGFEEHVLSQAPTTKMLSSGSQNIHFFNFTPAYFPSCGIPQDQNKPALLKTIIEPHHAEWRANQALHVEELRRPCRDHPASVLEQDFLPMRKGPERHTVT